MKVFCFDENEVIAAENLENAMDFYVDLTGVYEDLDVKEIPLTDKMWYSFYYSSPQLRKLIENNPDEIFEIKHNFGWRDGHISLHLTFERVIEMDNITDPCLIYSTE